MELLGDNLIIKDSKDDISEHHFVIISLVVDTSITVDRPIDFNYNTSATIELVTLNMNVAGTLNNPIIYEMCPPTNETWHMTRVLITMTDQSAMDYSKFGGCNAITNGVVLRETKENNTFSTITNWKINSDLVEDMFDVDFAIKAPAGFYGLGGRFTFDKAKAIIKLEGEINECLQILIQDDITCLDTFRLKGQGHKEGS